MRVLAGLGMLMIAAVIVVFLVSANYSGLVGNPGRLIAALGLIAFVCALVVGAYRFIVRRK